MPWSLARICTDDGLDELSEIVTSFRGPQGTFHHATMPSRPSSSSLHSESTFVLPFAFRNTNLGGVVSCGAEGGGIFLRILRTWCLSSFRSLRGSSAVLRSSSSGVRSWMGNDEGGKVKEEDGGAPPREGMWYIVVGLKVLRTRLADADVDVVRDEEAVDGGGGRGRARGSAHVEARDEDGREEGGAVGALDEDGADEDKDETSEEMDERKKFILLFSGLLSPGCPGRGSWWVYI